VFFGNLIGGSMADFYGRRALVLGSYAGMATLGAMTATAWGPASMLAVRFLFGIAYGMGIGPGVALLVESAPSSWRGHLLNFGGVFFALGELYVSVLLVLLMPTLRDPTGNEWRRVTLLAVMPGLLVLPFAFLLLKESPHFLLTRGRVSEALGVVRYIATVNGNEEVIAGLGDTGEPPEMSCSSVAAPSASAAPAPQDGSPEDKWQQLRMVFSRDTRWIVFGGGYLCFMANFLFYGLSYGLPQTFSSMAGEIRPAMQLTIVAACSFPGILLAAMLIDSKAFGHRDSLALLAILAALLQISLMAIDMGSHWHWMALPSAYFSKYVAVAFFCISYVYLGEVFPSVIRCTGLSICIAFGRSGSILAPMLFEVFATKPNPIGPHFLFLLFNAVLCLIGVINIRVCLSYELKNAPLEDLAAPTSETSGLQRRLSFDRRNFGAFDHASRASSNGAGVGALMLDHKRGPEVARAG